MLREAFRSACATTPHDLHWNRACEARFLLCVYWHSEHVWLVYAGSTKTRGTPAAACFVCQELPELGERPAVHRDSLGLSQPSPHADPAQIFQGNSTGGAFSLCHDAFRDDVIGVSGEPPFTAGAPLQQPLRRLGALLLQLGS